MREEKEERMEMGCEAKKKGKKDRISFHNHTYLRPTLPFRFPPFPEHYYTHTYTHIMPPGSLTPKITPDVTSRVFGQGTAAG